MRIGTIIDDVSPTESLEKGILAEKLGFHSLWFSDHLIDTGGIKVDPWTTMGAIAARTNKVELCSAVSDFQRVHPAKLAHMVATLFEISRGRSMLGLGAGEAMNLVPFGIEFKKEAKQRSKQLAEAIQVIKHLWKSSTKNPVSFKGEYFNLDNAWLDVQASSMPKVIVGALGGKGALEVAGKFGDGWVSWLNTPETFRKKLAVASSAAFSIGRKLDNFKACVWIYTVLTSDDNQVRKALDRAKRGLLSERHTLRMMGFERPTELGDSTFQSMLVSDPNVKRIPEMQGLVPDEIVNQVVAAGNAREVIERIEEFQRAGATDALIHFVGDEPGQMERFSSEVLRYYT
jgi:phthiodiolone/phenolphthiodiolone dimycocerosates ketoreductase